VDNSLLSTLRRRLSGSTSKSLRANSIGSNEGSSHGMTNPREDSMRLLPDQHQPSSALERHGSEENILRYPDYGSNANDSKSIPSPVARGGTAIGEENKAENMETLMMSPYKSSDPQTATGSLSPQPTNRSPVTNDAYASTRNRVDSFSR
jgi:hypothetical protein